MQEIVPLAAGVVIALLVQRFGTGVQSKTIALLAASLVIGAIASFVSGELFETAHRGCAPTMNECGVESAGRLLDAPE